MARDGVGTGRPGCGHRSASRGAAAAIAMACVSTPLAADVAPVGQEYEINTVTLNVQAHADVAMSHMGAAVVAWDSASTGPDGTDTSGRSIQAQRLDEAGEAAGNQFQVNEVTTGDQWWPAVAMSPDGRFAVVWQGLDAQLDGIRARFYDANGEPSTGEILVNTLETGSQIEPDVAWLVSGRFLVVWQSRGSLGDDASLDSVQARFFTGAGAADGGQFQVNTALTSGNQGFPSVAAAPGGGATVAWQSDEGALADPRLSVRARRLTAAGALLGSELILTTGNATIERPAVAVGPDGASLVAWSRLGGGLGVDLSYFSVEAQLIDTGGALDGGTLLLNEYTGGDQRLVTLAALSGGGFQATWQTDDAAGNDPTRAIATRTFDATGQFASGESQVNLYTSNNQEWPAVAIAPNGDGWIVWESNGSAAVDDSLLSIHGQRYSDDAARLLFYDGFESAGGPCAWSDVAPVACP